ncbi:MAG: ankyrin repeat domain-containing protein [Planctomycetales bacterium]|nr:ankyrin repeat domain-containing protein [Planctomycetales bacterium]
MPIHRAVKQGHLDEVMRLMGDDKSLLHMWTLFGTWLHDAASYGKRDIVQWLVSQGLDVNAYNDSTEIRPIDRAAANGQVDVVNALIEAGAVLDTRDSVRNPLFAAIVGGLSDSHTEVARVLIDSGIDTTVKYNGENMKDIDALAFAKEWGRSDIVKLLENS